MRNPVMADLFESVRAVPPSQENMAEGAVLLRGYARPFELELMRVLGRILEQAPFRRMLTPGGHQMSVAMTNCGSYGWVSLGGFPDRTVYLYDPNDPDGGKPWPPMPPVFRELAERAAGGAGFAGF